MIASLTLKFGRGVGAPREVIRPSSVTVFVGPNNAGKSKILQEIARYCFEGTQNITDVILERMEFQPSTPEAAHQCVEAIALKPMSGETLQPERVIVGRRGERHQPPRLQLVTALVKPNEHQNQFCAWYLRHRTLMLDGLSRIQLVNGQTAGDLQTPPQTSFQLLFQDDAKREEVRRIVYAAFGRYLIVDPTNLGQLRLRLADRPPASVLEERGLHPEAVAYHSSAMLIDQASDGVKALTGIITETIAGDPAVLLIDEPEAFLHPALVSLLGKEMAIAASKTEKRLFVSTHSANFVKGCIQSGTPVDIIRLTYSGGVATARVLSNTDILRLMRNPLLRSTGVLSGLFYEFVVVTEGDTDRAFYDEINERLLRYNPSLGIPNCLFVNAQNKQTVRAIIKPLRELGIPTAGIVDIDVLKEGGSVWTDLLGSAFIPELEQQSLGMMRSAVYQKFKASGRDMKTEGGVDLLETNDREAANNLFDKLAQYGLFTVRRGEVERWLPDMNVPGHGPPWLINMFERMGEDPTKSDYVKPSDDDVWAFTGTIKGWLTDGQRRGIPT